MTQVHLFKNKVLHRNYLTFWDGEYPNEHNNLMKTNIMTCHSWLTMISGTHCLSCKQFIFGTPWTEKPDMFSHKYNLLVHQPFTIFEPLNQWLYLAFQYPLPRPKQRSFQHITLQTLRGFNGSVNISENCDFRSQFDPFYIIV